ncbi:MAG: hypothetical protein ACK4VP_02205 [Nitrospira sp.]
MCIDEAGEGERSASLVQLSQVCDGSFQLAKAVLLVKEDRSFKSAVDENPVVTRFINGSQLAEHRHFRWFLV